MYHTKLPDNKGKLYGGAYSVHAPELLAERNKLLAEFANSLSENSSIAESIKNDFLATYTDWMLSKFNFKNVNLLTHACATQGTTESFAQFYIRYRNAKRLRLAKGEYFYSQMMKSLWYSDRFAWLDEDKIKPGDVVLISLPFADTGGVYNNLDQLLTECDQHQVPVMLDMAYLNCSTGKSLNYELDFAHPCIEYVVSSLSKVFPVENLRIGIRLQKEKFEDQLYVINEPNYNYINLCSAYIGTGMMKKFDADYVFNQYRQKQIELCNQLNLEPSPCFIFGIDHNNQFPQYNRGGTTNRLCFSRLWDGRSKTEGLVE